MMKVGRAMDPAEDPWVRWAVVFLILFVRFVLVPNSTYSVFLNLMIIVTMLGIQSAPSTIVPRFAVTRIAFLIVIFTTIEHYTYHEQERDNSPSILGS